MTFAGAQLQELGATLVELWNLMDLPTEEKKLFEHVTSYISSSADEVKGPGELAYEIIEQAEIEVRRLDELKASKMKELVLKKQTELEDIYRRAHVEVDGTSAREGLMDQINSGTDLSELLASMDEQIAYAKEEALSRKEIMEKVDKWMVSREEESWLEDYNKDQNRYNAGKGAHKNLKRAERARLLVSKLPALVETLVSKTKAWEEERRKPFLYDGVPLLSTLNEDAISRQEREEEKRRQREQKRVQELQATEQESVYGSKPSPSKPLASKKTAGQRGNSSSATVTPRRLSVTPIRQAQSASRDSKREHSRFQPVNIVALSRDDTGSQVSEIGSVASNTQ